MLSVLQFGDFETTDERAVEAEAGGFGTLSSFLLCVFSVFWGVSGVKGVEVLRFRGLEHEGFLVNTRVEPLSMAAESLESPLRRDFDCSPNLP